MQLVHIINLNKIKFVAKINYQKLGDFLKEGENEVQIECCDYIVEVFNNNNCVNSMFKSSLSLLLVLLLCLMCMI